MKTLIFASLTLLTACMGPTEYVYIAPDVPAETLEPCPTSHRRNIRTTKSLAAWGAENLKAAQCANGKLSVVKEILTTASKIPTRK